MNVQTIEVLEDLTSRSRCDEGFLHVRRLRCRNRREDGSVSEEYRVDVVDRPRLDAVSVLVYRRGAKGVEVLTRQNLRPAAFFRKDKTSVIPDGRSHLFVEEMVAGLLEPSDHGEEGLRSRAAAEVREEAGFEVRPADIVLLGAAFFPAPGILSERIFPTAVDVTGKVQATPEGDGSPLEEGGALRWWPVDALRRAFVEGTVLDAKTEIALARLIASGHLG